MFSACQRFTLNDKVRDVQFNGSFAQVWELSMMMIECHSYQLFLLAGVYQPFGCAAPSYSNFGSASVGSRCCNPSRDLGSGFAVYGRRPTTEEARFYGGSEDD
jgi:hypothetical protein